ncbi:MAG: division/cell wall cluster transcriptional repressor MraZ [Lachnospiraceae bacterium]|nr:division/cell wall cluster transcriptional repressor MraZ [Lachnospiraceae bacterium]MDE6254509.1 division/cell wall cluster transcriptional repressor MraZ [Lachnospiraceae bacterium]
MFMGEYNHTIDTKGRLIVPAKFRESLGDEFVVTRGLDECLFVFPNEGWKVFEEKLSNLPVANKNARRFARFFLSGAAAVELDKQGRINIPNNLREYGGLEKEVVLIGVANRVEIWSKDRWEASAVMEDMDEIAENMDELGLSI